MADAAFLNSPHVRRRIALVVSIALFLALAWYEATKQARLQQAKLFPDSIVYLQTAAQPLAFDQLFYPKPITVPAIYHYAGTDPAGLAALQLHFAIVAWTLLGLVLCASLRRWRARLVAAAIAFVFLLAPYRIGFASAILSESITDSLMALAVALALSLALATRLGRARSVACGSLAAALAIVTVAWLFARDSNPIAALVAIAIAGVLWRLHKSWRGARWAVVLAAVVAIASVLALWTTRVGPSAPTHLTVHEGCPPAYFPRTAFPTTNNVMLRVLPDPGMREFFVAHGLPQADELATLTWDPPDRRFYEDPGLAPARTWIAEHAASVYLRWLAAHPLDRADELARRLWDALASEDLGIYMPVGWIHVFGFPGWTVRRATSCELLLLALVLAAPLALRRPRGHITTAVAVVLIGSGVAGAAAAYYGDAYEIARHMFGAGQQIVLGLFLAPLAWLDRPR